MRLEQYTNYTRRVATGTHHASGNDTHVAAGEWSKDRAALLRPSCCISSMVEFGIRVGIEAAPTPSSPLGPWSLQHLAV